MPSNCLNGRQEESTITNCGKEKNDSHKDELKLKFVVRFQQALLEKTVENTNSVLQTAIKNLSSCISGDSSNQCFFFLT